MKSGEFWVLEFLKREKKNQGKKSFFYLMRKNNIILICFVAMSFFHYFFIFFPLIWELEFVKKLLQSQNYLNLCAMMEFWLNSNLIPIVVLRQILYLQNIMLKINLYLIYCWKTSIFQFMYLDNYKHLL